VGQFIYDVCLFVVNYHKFVHNFVLENIFHIVGCNTYALRSRKMGIVEVVEFALEIYVGYATRLFGFFDARFVAAMLATAATATGQQKD
jgi:hypothetical protein